MKLTSILSAFTILLLLPVVYSLVTQNNTIYYGVLESDGSINGTTQTIQNASILGFICSTPDCSTTSGTLWSGNVINLGSNVSTILDYPTTLQDQGYGLYFYKKGLISYEVKSNWSGSSSTADASRYLAQKRDCQVPISSVSTATNSENLTLSAIIASPINNSGPLTGIPSQLSSFYAVDVNVSATVNGTTQTQTLNIPFSNFSAVQFNFTLPSGAYPLTLSATTNNDLCLNTLSSTSLSSITIPVTPPTNITNGTNVTDTTPPAQISNLVSTNQTSSTITWNWTNPSNFDFNQSMIFINSINVLNTSNPFYTASGLFPNTTYTISVLTKDNSGNINTTAVSNTNSTFPSLSSSGNQTNQTNQTVSAPTIQIFSPLNQTYNTTNILLSLLTTNASQILYSLDNSPNITYLIPINILVSNGLHTLTASAINSNGTISSTVIFSINASSSGSGNQTNQTINTNTTNPGGNNKKKGISGGIKIVGLMPKNETNSYSSYNSTPVITLANNKSNQKLEITWLILSISTFIILLILLIIFTLISRR